MPYITIEGGSLTREQKSELIRKVTEVASEIMQIPMGFKYKQVILNLFSCHLAIQYELAGNKNAMNQGIILLLNILLDALIMCKFSH